MTAVKRSNDVLSGAHDGVIGLTSRWPRHVIDQRVIDQQVMDRIPSRCLPSGPAQRPHILTLSVAEPRRVPQIDGLRAIAILMVFGAHAFGIPLFWMGVDLFFVLSGYLITGVLLRLKESRATGGSYWSPFYLRRMRRILPPYVAFLAVLSLFFRVPWGHIWYWYVFFAPNIPLALGKVTVAAMGPLWSLGVEEQFYFVWPCLVLACNREVLRRVALGVIVFSPLVRAISTPLFATHFPIYSLTLFRADTLAVGAFIALSARSDTQWIGRHRPMALGGAGLAVALLMGLWILPNFRPAANSILFNSIAYSLSAACFGSLLIYTLGARRGFLHAFLTATPLTYLGVISYTFYLYHEAVLLKMGQYVHSRGLIALAAFSVTTLISALSWQLFEAPILGRSTKKPAIDLASRAGTSAAFGGPSNSEDRRTGLLSQTAVITTTL
jgi:peptidoglycan/LPS O-acetylase OafA/YrhL